ncbi:MAG: DNA/RNA nuclease SfsA [Halieaceae bacterium]|jgi:sugar fermentation stimulation protein A|nr:DNA/RNA nuclease SfsA [Halieaceae bacterium]
MKFDALITARLKRRYKRFLADVELDDGEIITVHCPNTGAMTGCAEPGSPVWLSRSERTTRKYQHTWELVETTQGIACVHSAKANRVVREAFEAGVIPGFEAYPRILPEVRYGRNSRADLLLEGDRDRVFVEVKSVTLCQESGRGAFPDAVSVRGTKHIRELQAIRDLNTRAVLFFCILHAGIRSVSVAGNIDPVYREALCKAMVAGVEVVAWQADISPSGITLARALPFSLDP